MKKIKALAQHLKLHDNVLAWKEFDLERVFLHLAASILHRVGRAELSLIPNNYLNPYDPLFETRKPLTVVELGSENRFEVQQDLYEELVKIKPAPDGLTP